MIDTEAESIAQANEMKTFSARDMQPVSENSLELRNSYRQDPHSYKQSYREDSYRANQPMEPNTRDISARQS